LNGVAKYSGEAWSAFPHMGVYGEVYALATLGSDLYAGGRFIESGDVAVSDLNSIAKYSGDTVSALPNRGFYSGGAVVALVPNGNDLYVGGGFRITADEAVESWGIIALKNSNSPFCPIVASSTSQADSDGDGLPDCWETNGYDADGDGIVDVDLPAMGADPLHKDIFVQIDYMVAQDHYHYPSPAAIQTVVAAFDRAPVENLDGKDGIHLHVDFGANAPLTWGETPTWGNLSRSKPIAEQQYIGTCSGDSVFINNFNDSEFKKIKNQNFPSERNRIFHYNVWAHSLCALSNDGGISLSAPGSDFIVTLGKQPTEDQQVGTFMHELGHNLGLCHGGPKKSADPSTNCPATASYEIRYKPNYLSVMNLYFNYYGLIINGKYRNYDYSKFNNIPSLNEGMLDETVGLNGGTDTANYATIYYCNATQHAANSNQPIDWNCDGKATSTNIQADINNDSAFTLLNSDNDWANLILPLPAVQADISSASGVTQVIGSTENDIPAGDIPLDLATKNLPPYVVDVQSPSIMNLHPGDVTTLNVTVANLGVKDDTYTLNYTAEQDWFDHTTLPASLDVASGITKTVAVTIRIPNNVSSGTKNMLVVSASSRNDSNLLDDTIIFVTVDPRVAPVFLPLIRK